MKQTIIFLIIMGIFTIPFYQVFAETSVIHISTDSSAQAPLLVTPIPVDYQLPYPGLLPDNVLYKLKTLRDKIIEFLISDPLKKAEFDILQGDKRYNASLFLYRQSPQQEGLIVSTISKADNYMTDAISQLTLAKKQGENINDMYTKFLLSNQKHLEVTQEIENTASNSLKTQLMREDQRLAQLNRTVVQIGHK